MLAAEAVQRGFDLISPCGGDGTINEALQGMAGSDAVLAPLPAGTANVFARETGLPLDPARAAALLPELVEREAPLGVVELPDEGRRRFFLLMCGAGVDAGAVYRLNGNLKRRSGFGAYVWSGLQQLVLPFEKFRMSLGAEQMDCTLVVISKSRIYGGVLILTPGAHLLSEHFKVIGFRTASGLRYATYAAALLLHKLSSPRGVERRSAAKVELRAIDPSSRVHVQVDGELAGELPARVRLGPETVRVLLPPEYCDHQESPLLARSAG